MVAIRDGGLIEMGEQEDPEAMPRAGRNSELREWPLHRAGRIRSDVTAIPITEVPAAPAALEARTVTGRLAMVP